MRIIIKGGVWKNTEDEILKAAVMKYGKNQWSRISSLLVRKSAKQCKARWYEWLDPTIRKVEWSREEEEKLLHLAKLMPAQWRTIAQAMNGRTSSQCMDHYEKLLNAAQDKDGADDGRDDPRRLRPGEIDPNPETKPARPDPIDMNDDEKEMLQEARARLANTKGKKAKRKVREKQLEEARRLAALQKARELKAAGISTKRFVKKRKGVDYNAEIPFERPVPMGFFDIAGEINNEMKQKPQFKGALLQDIDEYADKRRDKEEQEARARDAKKQKLKQKFDVPNSIMQVNKLNDPEQLIKKTKLSLPKPQLSEAELEEIVRIQQLGGSLPSSIQDQLDGGATQTLLSDYSTPQHQGALGGGPGATPIRTPTRTPTGKHQALMNEARNLAILNQGATPLKGDENVPLTPSNFSTSLPKHEPIRTPNPLATPQSQMYGANGTPFSKASMTPGTPASIAGKTPVRDMMNINDPATSDIYSRGSSVKSALRDALSRLPAPQYEYDTELPSQIDDEEMEETRMEEDAEEKLKRAEQDRKKKEEEMMKQRSMTLQKNLPRPKVVNKQPDVQGKRTNEQQVEDLIKMEVQQLLLFDAYKYPVVGTQNSKKNVVVLEKFNENEIAAAQNMIANELINYTSLFQESGKQEFQKAWEDTIDEFMFVPSQKRYARTSAISRPDHVAALQQQFELIRNQMVSLTNTAMKLEKKLKITTGGYQSINEKFLNEVDDLHAQIDQANLELHCFNALSKQEEISIQRRLGALSQAVSQLKEEEKQLQTKYSQLSSQVKAIEQQ
eukprot:c20098_g1_i1.p1 GENE.c20098_g1_i1~~c20098_g1_i1.p1  ORF type:complete len:785 (+),score=399.26 c20098_g1_i1:76-2430(+)